MNTRSVRMRLLLCLVMLAALLVSLPDVHIARAAGIVVNSLADTAIAGDGQCTLREAIWNANEATENSGGDCESGMINQNTITFDPAIFSTPQTILLRSKLPIISTSLTISGPAAARVTINAGNEYGRRILTIRGTPPGIAGLVSPLEDAKVDATDGSDELPGYVSVTLNNLNLLGGVCPDGCNTTGGGIDVNNGSLKLKDCILSNNRTVYGGGIGVQYGALIVDGSAISDNWGAGIYAYESEVTILNSLISGNTAYWTGGGIYASHSTLTITNTTIHGNSVAEHFISFGGGIYHHEGLMTITSSTISGNSTTEIGGGVYMDVGSTAYMRNSIVSGNTARQFPNIFGKLSVRTNNVIDVDARLDALADHGGLTRTRQPLPGSPAINLGNTDFLSEAFTGVDYNGDGDTADILEADQRGAGYDRFVGSRVDIGAFETNSTNTPVMIGIYKAGNWWLRNRVGEDGDLGQVWYGSDGWISVVGDWDGDGKDSPGIFKDGNWWLRGDYDEPFSEQYAWYGNHRWKPIVGDWDGDGKDSPGIVGGYAGGQWWLRQDIGEESTELELYTWYGDSTWTPVVGDWDGDGKDSPGIFKSGNWWLHSDYGEPITEQYVWYGGAGWTPIAGDWDWDGKDSPGIFQAGNWWLRGDLGEADPEQYAWYGGPGWTPVAGRWKQ